MKLNFDISKLKAYGASILASGKKNAPTIMTAGSVIFGWIGVYIFWKESKKAEQKIQFEEALMNGDKDSDAPIEEIQTLSVKDKFIIYLQYCWPSALFGLGSTALTILANRINLSRIAKMALLTKFMTDRNEKQNTLINELKEEIPEKKVRSIEQEIFHEEADEDAIIAKMKQMVKDGDTRTLFIDRFTGQIFSNDILSVTNGIESFNDQLVKKRAEVVRTKSKHLRNERCDPFYASSDDPWWNDDLTEEQLRELDSIYSTFDVTEFLYSIGEISRTDKLRLGELMEFRCFGEDSTVKQASILKYDKTYKQFFDKGEEVPEVCVLDYSDLLYPSYEFIERDII